MKKILLFLLLAVCISCLYAQTEVKMDVKTYTQDPNAPYRLYQTKNMYTFLKLDTRNGRIWQVQWSTDVNEFETILSYTSQVPAGEPDNVPGRFTLYATSNIYTFLLVDQQNGNVYHVQWHGDRDKRVVSRIY